MKTTFQYQHATMLLKYSGISFISGAVNHGFFSGERSLWTAAIGIVLFVIGAWMEHQSLRIDVTEKKSNLLLTLMLGALLATGLGFFTGGLQHFLDSPERSLWVVPVGFVISLVAFAVESSHKWHWRSSVYAIGLGCAITLGLYGTWRWLENNPTAVSAHAHAEQGSAHASDSSSMNSDGKGTAHAAATHDDQAPPNELMALKVGRVLEIQMDDQFRFTPDTISTSVGEVVRLIVKNKGKLPHELVLGSDAEIRAHAELMRSGGAHDHRAVSGSVAVAVQPGRSEELVIKFVKAGKFEIACLVPGHYEAGMRGVVTVDGAMIATDSSAAHDQGSHANGTAKH